MIVGRENERKELLELLEKDESQFCAVYGRRRVGKTYLIRETFVATLLFRLQFSAVFSSAVMANTLSCKTNTIICC